MSRLYGRDAYGAGPYGMGYPPVKGLVPTQVWVCDKLLNAKAMYQAGASALVSLSFTHGAKGCGSCTLRFAREVDIEKDDRIKIRLFNSLQWFYSGVIRNVPIEGSTKKGFEYTGYGYNDYFKRLNAGSLNHANKTISFIMLDLINNKIIGNSPIAYNPTKFQPPAITLVSLKANYCQVDEVLDAVLKIANSTGTEYNYGVDKDGDFFFLPRSEDIKEILVVGKRGRYGIPSYEPEDTNEARTKIIVLDKDGVYLTTLNSTIDNEIWEEKVTAPDIDSASALLWAAGILAEKERTTRSASIEWRIRHIDPDVLTADGYIRVISNIPPKKQVTMTGVADGDGLAGDGYAGGGAPLQWSTLDDTLAIKEVKYKINNKKSSRSIELGALPLRIEDTIVKINKNLTDLKVSLGV